MTLGQVAYEAYRKAADEVSLVLGYKLPDWDMLYREIKSAWESAAEAVKDEVCNIKPQCESDVGSAAKQAFEDHIRGIHKHR